MGFNQILTGKIEPRNDPAWDNAPSSLKRAYYDRAGQVMLKRLAKQLGNGVGANGRKMKVRIQPVLADGADGPVMMPHYELSRVITLADYMATDHSLVLFFHAGTGHASHRRARKARKRNKKARPATPFGDILAWHAAGAVPHAPPRDVRLSRMSQTQIQLAMQPWWRAHRPGARVQPRPQPQPQPYPRPFVQAGQVGAGVAISAGLAALAGILWSQTQTQTQAQPQE